jgi:hypothetical protein
LNPIHMDFSAVPEELKTCCQWVVRRGKQPIGKLGASDWNQSGAWFTFSEALAVLQTGKYDGLGFIVARDDRRDAAQVIGGDLDCCHDPMTGWTSPWAEKMLKSLDTYTEISPSGCGFRFFCYGMLPEGLDSVFSHGPDDLTDEAKAHILEAKPSAREKLAKGEPAFNGLEIYEHGPRHLTVTGQHVDGYPQSMKHRSDQVRWVIAPLLEEARLKEAVKKLVAPMREKEGLPKLDILSVIDTTGFTESGGQLFGPHPILGSTTGHNLVVNPIKNVYCWMHNGIDAGGDAWTWLACECGAVSWEQAGAGALKDAQVMRKTLEHAVKRGLAPAEIIGPKPKSSTVIDAIKALAGVCDGAQSKDGQGFSKFDREEHEDLIGKAVSEGFLSPKGEKIAYTFLKKYKRQLKLLGLNYDEIGHIPRPEGGGEDEKASFATRLVELATEDSELWHTPEDEAYITFHRDGHKEHHRLKDRAVKLWLSSLFHQAEGRTPGSQAVQDALNVLEGKALFEGLGHPVYVRVAPYEDKVYVDLGRSEWECIEITSSGWKVVPEAPVKFRRPKTLGKLPLPEKGGDLDDLRKLINAGDDRTWLLIVGWLVQGFWPSGPYAHLNFTGEQGSGKTKAQEMLKSMIDPSATTLRRPPRDEKDLMIAAKNERIPSFDNLSGMPDYLSDAFCCLSTGAALGTRELYTDSEEAVLSARRPCVMNGIDTLTYRGDLLDRTIVIELPKINEKDRRLEKDVMAAFEAIRPKIFGQILDATVCGLKHEKEVSSPKLPRMADFCLWVMACEASLPWEKGKFLKAYMRQADDSIAALVDGDQVARAVYDLALEHAQGKRWFDGTATELLDELSSRKSIDLNRAPKGWPKTANTLVSRLRRVAPALRKRGVAVDSFKPDRNTKLVIVHLEAIPVDLETIRNKRSSPQNQQAALVGDDGDDRDDLLHTYSVGDEEKNGVKEKEIDGRRIDGKKIVSIVSSSLIDRSTSVLPETMPNIGSSPIISGSSQGRELEGIKAELLRAEEVARAKEEHIREVAERFTSSHEDASPPSSNCRLQSGLQDEEELGPSDSEKREPLEEAVTPISPPGFTQEEHAKMLRAVERLRHKRYPLMISSNYGASLISESGLTSDRIRSWMQAMGFRPKILELSGLEVWEEGEAEATEEDLSCSSCPVALKGDKSAIRCDPCLYLARVDVQKSPLPGAEASPQITKAGVLS